MWKNSALRNTCTHVRRRWRQQHAATFMCQSYYLLLENMANKIISMTERICGFAGTQAAYIGLPILAILSAWYGDDNACMGAEYVIAAHFIYRLSPLGILKSSKWAVKRNERRKKKRILMDPFALLFILPNTIFTHLISFKWRIGFCDFSLLVWAFVEVSARYCRCLWHEALGVSF